MSNVTVINHPLVQHKLSLLRDEQTGTKAFRELVAELAMLMGYPSSTCIYSPRCGNAPVLEADGAVYCCDHYVPHAVLGNVFDTPLLALLSSERMFRFGQQKMPTAERCASCEFLRLCYGGCPRHRDVVGVNRLCEGYQAFFRHTLPYFREIAATIRQQA